MNDDFQAAEPQRYEEALARFDQENARDPNVEWVDGRAQPRELIHANWLSGWVLKLCPEASEALRLAARCQHICRWMVPRDSYPLTRAGYLAWRADLKKFHAAKAGEILREVGYPEEMIGRVQALNLKQNFPQNADSRVLEDALCLVFLEHQFAELAAKTTDEKMIVILQKSWKKMTPTGRALALHLPFTDHQKALLARLS